MSAVSSKRESMTQAVGCSRSHVKRKGSKTLSSCMLLWHLLWGDMN